jgi:2-iminobutanoate/2-iminopropanoate deaminase
MEKRVFNIDEGMVGGAFLSHAAEVRGTIYISGMVPIDTKTGAFIKDDIKAATTLVLEQLKKVVERSGSHMENVVKVSIYLRNMDDFAAMNEVYQTYFPNDPPARTTLEVKKIVADLPIEIEAVAVK